MFTFEDSPERDWELEQLSERRRTREISTDNQIDPETGCTPEEMEYREIPALQPALFPELEKKPARAEVLRKGVA